MPSPILGITEINQSQASKYLTANEAFRRLEQGAQHFVVLDRDLTAPPGTPTDGNAYIVAAGGIGDWAGHDSEIAFYLNGAWKYLSPLQGWLTSIQDEAITVKWTGSAWEIAFAPYAKNNFSGGAAPTAGDDDAAGYSQNSLWVDGSISPHEIYRCIDATTGAAVWVKTSLTIDELGALAALDTIGTAQIDADAVTYAKMQNISASQRLLGRNTAGAGDPEEITPEQARNILAVREKLAANRTYYVDPTNGSDSNDGLSSGAGAFATVQKAIDVAFGQIDLGGYDVLISLADDNYNNTISVLSPQTGSGIITLQGNVTTPSNVHISTSGDCIQVENNSKLNIEGMKLTSSAGVLIDCNNGGNITVGQAIEFGSAYREHIRLRNRSVATLVNDYTISGGATIHLNANSGSTATIYGATCTLSGTPDFSSCFVRTNWSYLESSAMTFSGSASGSRYAAQANGIIQTFGSGASYFPGDAVGTEADGGLYL